MHLFIYSFIYLSFFFYLFMYLILDFTHFMTIQEKQFSTMTIIIEKKKKKKRPIAGIRTKTVIFLESMSLLNHLSQTLLIFSFESGLIDYKHSLLFLKPATHLAILFADRQRKSLAIFATDRMRTHLAIFFANRGDVALQPCSQAPSATAIRHFEKSCDKIAQSDWLTLLAIRGDVRKKSRERTHKAIAGEFNRRYLTCQISVILYSDRGDRRKSQSLHRAQ